MASIGEIRKARIKKLEHLNKAGELAYPATSKRTHEIGELLKGFSALAKSKKEVFAVGRIRSIREHGGSTFFHIEDETGQVQVYLKKDGVGEKMYQFFLDTFDVGDFAQVRGTLFSTKKGEKTIEARSVKILAKSLLPLPEKWHGLKDEEERYRKRYLDLLFNKEVKEKFEKRTTIVRSIREFLDKVHFHHLLVVEGNKLVGVISDRDVLKAVSPFIGTLSEHNHDLITLNKKAHQIMNHKPITIFKDASLQVAATIMMDNNISCLPVVSPEGGVEGIVTWKDILRYYIKDNKE